MLVYFYIRMNLLDTMDVSVVIYINVCVSFIRYETVLYMLHLHFGSTLFLEYCFQKYFIELLNNFAYN